MNEVRLIQRRRIEGEALVALWGDHNNPGGNSNVDTARFEVS